MKVNSQKIPAFLFLIFMPPRDGKFGALLPPSPLGTCCSALGNVYRNFLFVHRYNALTMPKILIDEMLFWKIF